MPSRQTGLNRIRSSGGPTILATNEVMQAAEIDALSIKAIGIAYQMHGLVLVDKNHKLLRLSHHLV